MSGVWTASDFCRPSDLTAASKEAAPRRAEIGHAKSASHLPWPIPHQARSGPPCKGAVMPLSMCKNCPGVRSLACSRTRHPFLPCQALALPLLPVAQPLCSPWRVRWRLRRVRTSPGVVRKERTCLARRASRAWSGCHLRRLLRRCAELSEFASQLLLPHRPATGTHDKGTRTGTVPHSPELLKGVSWARACGCMWHRRASLRAQRRPRPAWSCPAWPGPCEWWRAVTPRTCSVKAQSACTV